VDKFSYEGAKEVLDTNYHAVKSVISKLLPVLRPGARIVNMGSSLGQLQVRNSGLAGAPA
jgi:NAD(P)-dependent dehydrogenase (short-subunit alcohol dehydrogenase family)